MSFFPSLPVDAGVRHIASFNPAAGQALIRLHTAALRNDSPLTVKDKELIAAYVSGLNRCHYCYGVHSQTAQAFGVPEDLLEQLLVDIDTAPIDDALKPVMHYARKLTQEPSRMTEADAQAVFRAGWSEIALHEAVLTICLFNFMNRLLDGHGITGHAALYETRGKALKENGYDPLLNLLQPK
jgi:uncharacterized peroxidase-related enzyme